MRCIKQKTKELDRTVAEEIAIFERHFQEFRRVVTEKGISPGDIYNMDETGFRIGIGGSQWIVTMDWQHPQQSPSDANRDYAISIECVAGDGTVIDPMLIMKGVSHLEKWYSRTSVPDEYLIGTSDSGYTNDMLSIDWIKHFDKCTRSRTTGIWRLLIFDGYDSHCTKPFLDFCEKTTLSPSHYHPIQVSICNLLTLSFFNHSNIITKMLLKQPPDWVALISTSLNFLKQFIQYRPTHSKKAQFNLAGAMQASFHTTQTL